MINDNVHSGLNGKFWDSKYENGNTGWDIGEISTPLKMYFDQLKEKDIKILIPGCGNAYEAVYLLEKGFTDVTLIDISEVITAKLKSKFNGSNVIRVLTENFFGHNGKYDLIVEQTFFCALIPSQREAYCLKMKNLLNINGKIAGVLFDREFETEGPPFGGSADKYNELFQKHFHVNILEKCYNSIEPRTGNEVFINLKKTEH